MGTASITGKTVKEVERWLKCWETPYKLTPKGFKLTVEHDHVDDLFAALDKVRDDEELPESCV